MVTYTVACQLDGRGTAIYRALALFLKLTTEISANDMVSV